MSDWKRMFELKQDDWIAVCKEVDALKSQLAVAVEAFENMLEHAAGYEPDAQYYLQIAREALGKISKGQK
jgi:hypothetical protein